MAMQMLQEALSTAYVAAGGVLAIPFDAHPGLKPFEIGRIQFVEVAH
jgi:hypothetical protein